MIDLSFACTAYMKFFTGNSGACVKIDNDCTHDYNITFYSELAAKGWMKTITQIRTHTGK